MVNIWQNFVYNSEKAILINEHSWFSKKLKLLCKQQNLSSHGLFNAASFSENWVNHSSQIIGKISNNVTVKAKCFLTNSTLHSDFTRKIYNIIFQLIYILIMYPWQFKKNLKLVSFQIFKVAYRIKANTTWATKNISSHHFLFRVRKGKWSILDWFAYSNISGKKDVPFVSSKSLYK